MRSLVYLMMAFWVSGTLAQDVLTLSLDQSVSLAFENNPEYQMAQKEVAKARAGVWQSYSTILPKLDGSASLQHAWSIQENTIPNFIKPMLGDLVNIIPEAQNMPDFVKLSFGLENTLRYGLTLNQPLFLGGAGIAGIRIAKASERIAELNLQSQQQSLIYQTSNAFYSCLLAAELITVQQQALEQAQANLELVTKKYNVGSASGFDQMRAKVEVANLEPELITAKNNYQMALTQLRNVLGLEKTTQINVKGSFEYKSDEFGQLSLIELQRLAEQNRPEITQLRAQKQITKSSVTAARSNFLPKVVFTTDYSYLAMRNDYEFAQDDFSKGFTSMISLQIPLFQGFKNTKAYQQAKLDHKIMLDTEKQIRDGIFAQIELAFNGFQEAKEKYQAASESVELAEESLRLATLMYEEGASTQLDVLNAQLALNRARLNYVSSLYEYTMARYQLRQVTGTLEGTLSR